MGSDSRQQQKKAVCESRKILILKQSTGFPQVQKLYKCPIEDWHEFRGETRPGSIGRLRNPSQERD